MKVALYNFVCVADLTLVLDVSIVLTNILIVIADVLFIGFLIIMVIINKVSSSFGGFLYSRSSRLFKYDKSGAVRR